MFNRFWNWMRAILGSDQSAPNPNVRPDVSTAAPAPVPAAIAELVKSVGCDASRSRFWFDSEAGPVYSFALRGPQAETAWRALVNAFGESGYWPVIVGDDECVARHDEFRSPGAEHQADTLGSIRTRASNLDLAAWAQERQRLDGQYDEEYSRPVGDEWPEPEGASTAFYLTQTLTGKKQKPHVHIALFPVADCSEVLALLRYGDWNACPPPEVHVAMCRHLSQLFGARLAAIGPDTIEYEVPKPPETLDAALDTAQLLFDYCEDIVTQGVGTIRALAVHCKSDRRWFFWWD